MFLRAVSRARTLTVPTDSLGRSRQLRIQRAKDEAEREAERVELSLSKEAIKQLTRSLSELEEKARNEIR